MKKYIFLVLLGFALSSGAATAPSNRFHLGFSTDAVVTRGGIPSISALMGLSEKLALQLYAGLFSSSPFNFGVGGVVKYTVAGDISKGFHMGGGAGLGLTQATEKFFVDLLASAGFHFQIVESVLVLVDGGLGLLITTGTAGSTDVQLAGNSGLLGISLLYRL